MKAVVELIPVSLDMSFEMFKILMACLGCLAKNRRFGTQMEKSEHWMLLMALAVEHAVRGNTKERSVVVMNTL